MLQEMILYKQVSDTPLPAGLYLGYLQTEALNGTINVYTSELNPNTLPMVKIRWVEGGVKCNLWYVVVLTMQVSPV